MTSERQAEANRQNATKSTGPRTPAGKAVVTLNGIKHGLLSRECLLKGESETEFVAFGKRLRAKLAPVGELELPSRIALSRQHGGCAASSPWRRCSSTENIQWTTPSTTLAERKWASCRATR
jgi:hypothetical protein